MDSKDIFIAEEFVSIPNFRNETISQTESNTGESDKKESVNVEINNKENTNDKGIVNNIDNLNEDNRS